MRSVHVSCIISLLHVSMIRRSHFTLGEGKTWREVVSSSRMKSVGHSKALPSGGTEQGLSSSTQGPEQRGQALGRTAGRCPQATLVGRKGEEPAPCVPEQARAPRLSLDRRPRVREHIWESKKSSHSCKLAFCTKIRSLLSIHDEERGGFMSR